MSIRLPFTPADEQKVLCAIQNWSLRNRCLIEFGLNVGFRATELGSILIGQVWDGSAVRDEVTVERCCLKGGRGLRRRSVRSRTVPINAAAKAALNSFLSVRQAKEGYLDPNAPLFRSTQTGRGLKRWRINVLVQRAARAAGLPNAYRYGGHSLRRRFATRVYQASGRDLNVVRLSLGHANVTTTQKYLYVDESAVRSAIMAIGT